MNLSFAGLVLASLICFAGNSLLCRAALGHAQIGAALFTGLRISAGAVTLLLISFFRKNSQLLEKGSWLSAAALSLYAGLFSLAYLRIDAGIGALILFGAVQVTMLGWSIAKDHSPSSAQWAGLCLALLGLGLLVVPGKSAPDPVGFCLMLLAGTAWGTYSLRGRGVSDPLGETTMNFVRSLGFAGAFWILSPASASQATPTGLSLAIISGAITSGLGYTLWYAVLPKLGATRAGIVQLIVPVIALMGSIVLLGERLSARAFCASALILAGVWIALAWQKRGNKFE